MLGPESTEAIQIFVRPRAPGLEPKVQFHDFGEVVSRDAWRLIAAPEEAPLQVRAQAWVQDAHLSAGTSLALPAPQAPGVVRLLYVVTGDVRVDDLTIGAGESVYLDDGEWAVTAKSEQLILDRHHSLRGTQLARDPAGHPLGLKAAQGLLPCPRGLRLQCQ